MVRILRSGTALLVVLAAAACGNGAAPASSTGTGGPPASREAGLAAFETVRSVLQHPRCQNCHPAGDVPLQGDDSHPHLQNVQRGPDGHGMVGQRCTTCHGASNLPTSYGAHVPPGAATGWHMPKPDEKLVFVGVPAGELCARVKDPAHNGGKDMAALRTHLDDPLVTWGWNPGVGRAPVPVSRDAFLAAWTTWASAGTPCPK